MNYCQDEINRLKQLVETHIVGLLPVIDVKSKTLFDAISYTLLTPGKRIRPILLLLSCKAARGDENDAMPYACAVEFIHSYSLIHDDLPAMDDDDLRRGEPTNHKVFGEAMAILAGDGLLSAAFELIHNDYLLHVGDAEALRRRIRAGEAIATGCGCRGMVAGQVSDIESEKGIASPELLDYIHRNKTAALIRASMAAGSWLGGAKPEVVRALSDFGENLGLVFQIVDDLLDQTGATEVIGKTAGKDTKAGKVSYPGVYGIEASRKKVFELTERSTNELKNLTSADTDICYTDILIELACNLAERVR